MINLSEKELSRMTIESNEKVARLKSELLTTGSKIRTLHQERETKEGDLKKEEKKIEAIREAVILNGRVPRKVSAIRDRLLKVMSQAKRRDITIIKREALEVQQEELQKELQQKCSHPFVFHKEGYSGSHSNDYEDGYPSERHCVVCGLGEKAKDFAQNGRVDNVGRIFEVLKESEGRVVHSEPYRQFPNTFSRMENWVPLGVALKPFEEEVAKNLNS